MKVKFHRDTRIYSNSETVFKVLFKIIIQKQHPTGDGRI